MIRYSFIFPVLNEEGCLEKQLSLFLNWLGKRVSESEIIIVENGSTDDTWKILKRLRDKKPKLFNICQIEKSSYGRSIKQGILSASGEIIIVLDIDFIETDFLENALKKNTNRLIIGSKRHKNSKDKRGLYRKLLTDLNSYLLKKIIRYPANDPHGILIFPKVKNLALIINSIYSKNEMFDTELVLALTNQGMKLKEMPVNLEELRPTRYKFLIRFLRNIVDVNRFVYRKMINYSYKKNIGFCADDFGLSEKVNSSIISQQRAGSLKYISVLATHTNKRQTDKLSKQGIGIHLNLTTGRPVANKTRIKTLVDENGEFFPLPILLLRIILRKINNDEIKIELEEQFKSLAQKNLTINYIDSEQHIHLFSPIKKVVIDFAKANNLKIRARKSSASYLKRSPLKFLTFILLELLLNKNREEFINFLEQNIVHPGNIYD